MTTRPAHARPRPIRRGSAAVAVVIMLALLQLAVAGIVLAGARDNDLSKRRLDTLRAFYAAEAGANMSIRESNKNVDYDADGTIGGVASSGTRSIGSGGARVRVTRSTSGSNVLFTAAGTCGDASRTIQLTTQ